MKASISKILLTSVFFLIFGGSILTYADINVDQSIGAVVAYVKGLIFTDNGLPDGNVKALLQPSSDLSVEIRGSSVISRQVLIGEYCKNNYSANENIYKLCIEGGWQAGDIRFNASSVDTNSSLKIDIGNSLWLRSDDGYLLIIDKNSKSLIVDPDGLATFNNGVWISGPVQIGGNESIECNSSSAGTIGIVGGEWKVCEGGGWKKIELWEGEGLPTQLPTATTVWPDNGGLTPSLPPGETITPISPPSDGGYITQPYIPPEGNTTDPISPPTNSTNPVLPPSTNNPPSNGGIKPPDSGPGLDPVIFY